MAKANYVSLYGQVVNDPQLKMNKDSQIFQGKFVVKVLRRFVDENRKLEFSSPMVVSGNPEIATQMTTLKKGDMCYIKGVVTTMNVTRSWICDCGYTNRPVGTYTMITPLYIKKTEDVSGEFELSKDKNALVDSAGTKSLKANNEISNTVHVIGTVCAKNPFFDDGKLANFNFQIAVNRRYRLLDGDPDVRTDYPWVRVYGDAAREAADVLDINSTVFIDGSLFTKTVSKKTYCESCGKEHIIKELVSEIHPYSVEYLHNCNLPDKSYSEIDSDL